MPLYHSTDAEGISEINPSRKRLRELLDAVYACANAPEAERDDFEDVSLINDDLGWSLAVYPNGTVVLDQLNAPDTAAQILTEVDPGTVFGLWLALIEEDTSFILNHPWQPFDDVP